MNKALFFFGSLEGNEIKNFLLYEMIEPLKAVIVPVHNAAQESEMNALGNYLFHGTTIRTMQRII